MEHTIPIRSLAEARADPSAVVNLELKLDRELELSSLADMVKLTRLKLYNPSGRALPPEIAALPRLERLELKVRDSDGLEGLSAGPSLRALKIQATARLSLPEHVFELDTVETLELGRSKLRALPAGIARMTRLRHLELPMNGLRSLPKSLGRLEHLVHLDLDYNFRLGRIPEAVYALGSLRRLQMAQCGIQALDPAVAGLVSLEELTLPHNLLKTLPDAICDLPALRQLILGNNRLESLPERLGALPLTRLDVARNRLTRLPPSVLALGDVVGADKNPLQRPA